MTSRRDRIFAWVGVIVAALSAIALSAAVVIQQILTDRANKAQTDLQNAIQAQTKAEQAAEAACKDDATEQTLPVPDVFKPSGAVSKLETDDLVPGTGQAGKSGDCLIVKYYGTLASNGDKFDENFTQPTAFAFLLGKGRVIQGWDQGLVGMKVGGMRRLVIPASLAYGSQGSGSIPANSDLVFVVKLLRIQK